MFSQGDKSLEELERLPIVELSGVVEASGASGSKVKGQEWVLRFAFDSWNRVGGPLQNRELIIRKKVDRAELRSIMKQVAALEPVRIQARMVEDNSSTVHGLLVNIIGKDFFDPELKERIAALKKPITFEDKRFGVFTLDRRVNWFEAEEVSWGARKISLRLKSADPDVLFKCLATAYALWDSQSIWNERAADLVVAEFLDLKNGPWLQDGEDPLSAEQFRAAVQLESITAQTEGGFEFWHNDGDLFGGHAIRVSGSLSEGPTFAGIEG